MPGIDHVVHAVADLDRAATLFEALGFTLTPRAQHPFGTGNRLAQLQGGFIELLAVTKPDEVPAAGPGEFSFGAYNRDFLKAGEGMSMLALRSAGWETDRARFLGAGLPLFAPFQFGRTARQPDGREMTLDFRLTFTGDPAFDQAVFFTCDHRHPPDVFWKPAYKSHGNSAQRLSEVYMVADDPAAHAPFLAALLGSAVPVPMGLSAPLGDVRLTVFTPAALEQAFPGAAVPPPPPGQVRFAGYRVAVRLLSVIAGRAKLAGLAPRRAENRLWLAPADAFGALLAFSEG